jgi:hypothetical protein
LPAEGEFYRPTGERIITPMSSLINDGQSIHDLIVGARSGDEGALDKIFRVAYDDLHALAQARLSADGREGLQDTTDLLHESYLRLSQTGALKLEDRPHFLHYADQVMRTVIVDLTREHSAV